MSADGSITLVWGDGEHRFRTGIKEWREIQEKCGAGLIEIMDRLAHRRWKVDDVREPIRVGLIGGGMQPAQAFAVTKLYVDGRPLGESVNTAFAVLAAAIIGVPDEQAGKAETEETNGTDGSPSRSSTELEPS
jgi:hypothetical protein